MTNIVPLDASIPRRRGRSSPAVLALAARERAAIAMRTQGATYDEIAQQLGFADRSGARKAVERGMSRWMRETDEELRARELARTEIVIDRLMPQIDCDTPDHKAIDSLVKLMNLRGKLSGLYNKRPPANDPIQPEEPDPMERKLFLMQRSISLMKYLRDNPWMIEQMLPEEERNYPNDGVDNDDIYEWGRDFETAPHDDSDALDEADEDTDDEVKEERPSGKWVEGRFYPDPPPDTDDARANSPAITLTPDVLTNGLECSVEYSRADIAREPHTLRPEMRPPERMHFCSQSPITGLSRNGTSGTRVMARIGVMDTTPDRQLSRYLMTRTPAPASADPATINTTPTTRL
jgi:hypothetical protein